MIIGQAVLESGWGNSRFAVKVITYSVLEHGQNQHTLIDYKVLRSGLVGV
ncbi:MAG: hypothetical protein CM15mV18_0030 [uncultured marine virus]|nr:MAG: hypothetical protein CM15mV18_0030 [uncultured marine virus]